MIVSKKEELKVDFLQIMMSFKRNKHFLPIDPRLSFNEAMTLSHIDTLAQETNQLVLVSALVPYLRVSKPALSQTLNALEGKGYISRAISPSDRRAVVVMLTSEGESIKNQTIKVADDFLLAIIEEMGEEEFEKTLQNLKTLAAAASKFLKKNTCDCSQQENITK